VDTVAQRARSEVDLLRARAVEHHNAAAGRVRVAVVEVNQERGLTALVTDDLQGHRSEDAAPVRGVRGVIGDSFSGRVR